MAETSATSKVFTFEEDGLSYTITVSQDEDGGFYASLTILEGHADINALYFGDSDFTGKSASLAGPLNMNGAPPVDGENVQWDDALELSRPGLGPDADAKETYLQEGETLRIDLPITSLDEIDFIGIRATSTSTPEGSIKGVSEGEEVVDDCDDEEDDCDDCDTAARDDYPELAETTTGVTFGVDLLGEGEINEFIYVARDDLDIEGTPTFADYVAALDAQLEEDDAPCEAEPLKAIIYGPDQSETYYRYTPEEPAILPAGVVPENAPLAEEEEHEEPEPEAEFV